MKYIFFCFSLLSLSSCSSPQNKIKNIDQSDSIVNDNSINNKKAPTDIPAYILIDTLPIYATLKINPYSLDSIDTEVTIFNDSYKNILLYKPILPSDSLVENTFAVLNEKNYENLTHIEKNTNHKYYLGTQSIMPAILPEENENNFLSIEPGKSITFKINLARHYDFKDMKNKRSRTIFVEYGNLFPLIENGKHVYVKDENRRALRPVYFDISGSKVSAELGRIKIKLPSK